MFVCLEAVAKWSLVPAWKAYFLIFRVNCHLSADEHHGARRLHETRLIDAVAFFFFHNDRVDVGDEILIGGPFAKQRSQIVVLLAEQAGAELAIGGQPDAQKGWVTGAIRPISPGAPSAKRYLRAVSLRSWGICSSGQRAWIRW